MKEYLNINQKPLMKTGFLVLPLVIAGVCFTGCDSKSSESSIREITIETESADTEHEAIPRISTAERVGLQVEEDHTGHSHAMPPEENAPSTPAKDPHAVAGGTDVKIVWETPATWEELPGDTMRIANFKVTELSNCSLFKLKGQAGGLGKNLNRWRTQMALPQLSAEEINALAIKKLMGNDAVYTVMDGVYTGMSSTDSKGDFRMIGLTLIQSDYSYFVKLTGPLEEIKEQEKNFSQFCASIKKIETSALEILTKAGSQLNSDLSNNASKSFDAKVPEHWTLEPEKPMRLVSYQVSTATCYVSILGGDGGGVSSNINRWRGQLGLPAMSDEEIGGLATLSINGQQAPYIEVNGMGDDKKDLMLLGAICSTSDGKTAFIKMTGTSDILEKEIEHFKTFCSSLKL